MLLKENNVNHIPPLHIKCSGDFIKNAVRVGREGPFRVGQKRPFFSRLEKARLIVSPRLGW